MKETFYDIYDEQREYIYKLTAREPWKTNYKIIKECLIREILKTLECSIDEINRILKLSEAFNETFTELSQERLLSAYFDNIDDNIIKFYIDKKKNKLSQDTICVLEEIRIQNFSIFKVLDCLGNHEFLLQDILLKTKPVKIEYESSNHEFKTGQYVYTKIIPYDDKYYTSDLVFEVQKSEEFNKIINFLSTFYDSNLPDLSQYYTVPENIWKKIKEIVYIHDNVLCSLWLIPMLEEEHLRFSYSEITYKIINKAEIVRIMDLLKKYHIEKQKEGKWLYSYYDYSADISINDYKLIISGNDKEVLKDLNGLLKRKLKNCVEQQIQNTN